MHIAILHAFHAAQVVEHSGGYQLSVDGDQYKFDVDAKSTWTPYSFSFSCAELKLIPTAKNTQKDVVSVLAFQIIFWNYQQPTY